MHTVLSESIPLPGLSAYGDQISTIGVSCLYALSLYVVLRSGQFSLAHLAFGAIGAYVGSLLALRAGIPFLPAVLLGVLASTVVATGLAVTTARLRFVFLAIGTVGFAEGVRIVATNLTGLTGGPLGVNGIPREVGPGGIVLTVAVVAWLLHRVNLSRSGRAIAAVGADEVAARSQGISIQVVRVFAMAMSGAVAGLGGSLAAFNSYHIDPSQFALAPSLTILVYVVVGGTDAVLAPILGTVLISLIPNLVQAVGYGSGWIAAVLQGLIMLAVIVFMPNGIAGLLPRWPRRPATPFTGQSQRPLSLTIRQLNVSFGGVRAVRDANLDVRAGEILGIVGPNGAGKTTLVNAISGIVTSQSGTVTIDGVDCTNEPAHLIAHRGVARTFQNLRLFERMPAIDNVVVGTHRVAREDLLSTLLGLPRARRQRREMQSRAAASLEIVKLSRSAGTPAGRLAYGERRRLEIARALASEPGLLILDEPVAGMNGAEVATMSELVRAIAALGRTVIVIEHNLAFVRRTCDRVAVLVNGHVLVDGEFETVISRADVKEAYLGA